MFPWESGKGTKNMSIFAGEAVSNSMKNLRFLGHWSAVPWTQTIECLGHGFQDKASLAGLHVPNQDVRANYNEVYCHFIGMTLQNEAIYFFLNTVYNSNNQLQVEQWCLNNVFRG